MVPNEKKINQDQYPRYRWEKLLLIAFMVLLASLTYSNHFNNPFEFDDDHTILTNEHIRKLSNIPRFFTDATTTSSLPKSQAYRPGLTTLNAIDYWLGGKNEPVPFYYHLSIFIGFMLLGILLVFFIERIFQKYFTKRTSLWLAVFASTWFCVHTANAETINYIIARADSFSTLMIVLGLVMYIYLVKLRKFYLYMIPVIAGFMVKEPVVMFAPILVVYKILFEQGKKLGDIFILKKNNPLWIALQQTWLPFAIIVMLFLFSRKMTPDHWSGGTTDPWLYLISQPYVIFHYFNNFILPFNLVVDTDWTVVQRLFDDRVIIGCLFIATLVYLIFKTSHKHPPVAFGFIWFLLALLPTSSIFPLSEVLNDHRPFFPYIGLVIAFTYIAGRVYVYLAGKNLRLQKGLWMGLLGLVVVLHALGTRERNRVWSSGETLWKDATIKAPNNGRVWMNYGNTQLDKNNLEEAEMAYNKAKNLWPAYSYVYLNLGVLQFKQNKFAEAESNFKYGISCDSLNPECYVGYGDFLFRQNRMIECSQIVETGLRLSGQHEKLLALKASVDPFLGNPNQVLETKLSIALDNVKKAPTAENYLQLSLEYYNLKKYTECIDACNKALKLKPDYDLAYNNICSSYIQLGEWDLAINACEKGISISPHNELLNGNLQYAKDQKSKQQ
jgi:tetratricopeptide (TPR) repeat protein